MNTKTRWTHEDVLLISDLAYDLLPTDPERPGGVTIFASTLARLVGQTIEEDIMIGARLPDGRSALVDHRQGYAPAIEIDRLHRAFAKRDDVVKVQERTGRGRQKETAYARKDTYEQAAILADARSVARAHEEAQRILLEQIVHDSLALRGFGNRPLRLDNETVRVLHDPETQVLTVVHGDATVDRYTVEVKKAR